MDTTPPTGKTSILKILGIIMGILIIGFIGLMIFGSGDYNKDGDDIRAKTTLVLSQLKNSQFEAIYNDADSEFKKVSKKEDLEKLTKVWPALSTYTTSTIGTIKHDDVTATVEGTVTDSSKKTINYSIVLYKVGDAWKFYSIDIRGSEKIDAANQDPTKGKEDTGAKITEIRVGEGFDADGFASSQPKPVISSIASSIFVSVFTTQAAEVMMANVKIVHVATGDSFNKSLPIYKSTTGTKFTTRFQFTKPTNDWPKGKNKIIVTLANGNSKELVYEVK